MKTILPIIIFVLSIQISFGQYFKGGLFGGTVASQVHGDLLSGFQKFGITGGVFVDREINDRWAIQMELQYIQKGPARAVPCGS